MEERQECSARDPTRGRAKKKSHENAQKKKAGLGSGFRLHGV
jgi:hypothetical protein